MKILVINIPAWNLGFLGCYGNDWIVTPTLDRLASEGIVGDWHFSANPGLPRHGWTGHALAAEVPALPDLLRAQNMPFLHLEKQGRRDSALALFDQAGTAVRQF